MEAPIEWNVSRRASPGFVHYRSISDVNYKESITRLRRRARRVVDAAGGWKLKRNCILFVDRAGRGLTESFVARRREKRKTKRQKGEREGEAGNETTFLAFESRLIVEQVRWQLSGQKGRFKCEACGVISVIFAMQRFAKGDGEPEGAGFALHVGPDREKGAHMIIVRHSGPVGAR